MNRKAESINVISELMSKKNELEPEIKKGIPRKEEVIPQKINKKTEIKNLGGRPKKSEKYKKEREEVLKKLKDILGITGTNNIFYMYDIDKNEDKQQAIMDLKDDVYAYFGHKENRIFYSKTLRPYSSLLKIVLKEMGYTLLRTTKTIERDGKKHVSSCFILNLK
jgi:hypothetical protein